LEGKSSKVKDGKKPKPEFKKAYGSIIKLFDKTPKPKRTTDVFCPHFWELKYANGCKYDCQWCYLVGTFRFLKQNKAPRMKDIREVKKQLKQAMVDIRAPQLFNAGEVSDALVFEQFIINDIAPMFADDRLNTAGHKLLILTKSSSTRFLASASPIHTVVSHSVNARYVSNNFELLAPHPWDRLRASHHAADRGFETRLRIDPVVPVKSWHRGYKELCEQIMKENSHVDVITIGSLRGLQSTINTAHKMRKDLSWIEYISEKSNWGLRVPHEIRLEQFSYIIDLLRDLGYNGDIALCKEPLKMWKALKMKPGDAKCNCVL